MKSFNIIILSIAFIFSFNSISYAKSETKDLLFAVAASLKPVFEERLIPLFSDKYIDFEIKNINDASGKFALQIEERYFDILTIYDGSGRLEIQIKEGLDVDLFISAAPVHIERLVASGHIEKKNTASILSNKLVFIQNTIDRKKNPLASIEEIKNISILALANPKSAPVGEYSKQALEALGLYKEVEKKLSLAQSVSEVLYWVEAGSAPAGIVYASDVRTSQKVAIVAEIPYTNDNIQYMAGILKKSENQEILHRFIDFLQSDEAKKIFVEYGFMPL